MVCEGDAEAPGGSWSGSSTSLLASLRRKGHIVQTVDADLYGWRRLLNAVPTFSPNRQRWGVKFHLGAIPFWSRTRRAATGIRSAGHPDAILQIGATFRPEDQGAVPYYLYCDSNILMARHGAVTGFSEAAHLTAAQLEGVIRRERTVYDGAAGIFTLSDRLRTSFVEDFGQEGSKVHTVRAGPNFELSSFPPLTRRPGDLPPTILFVGAQFERKGGDLLLRAFRRVRSVLPEARLVIIGPRDLTIADDGVSCLGYLRKEHPSEARRLTQAYQEASVFCLPTRFEPFGIVFLEAMFFGLPCVGTDAWAVPEMVRDGITGYTFPMDDEQALTDRLLRILSDPVRAQEMGAAGRALAAAEFMWDSVADRMLAVITGAKPGP